jgi:hypothetical protein
MINDVWKMKWGNESVLCSDFQNGRTEQPKNEMVSDE